ncbi:hypothetical protein D3C85_1851950 [compost metagenome]
MRSKTFCTEPKISSMSVAFQLAERSKVVNEARVQSPGAGEPSARKFRQVSSFEPPVSGVLSIELM